MEFEIKMIKKDNISLIKLKGRLEGSVCESFKNRLINYIYDGNIYIALSLNNLTYFNTLTIGIIKSIEEEIKTMGGILFILVSKIEMFKYFEEPFFKVFRKEKEMMERFENIMFR